MTKTAKTPGEKPNEDEGGKMRRTDVLVAVGVSISVSLVAVVLAVAGLLDGFLLWAWERHHNVLSWYVRPLFILPLAYFSYRRSLSGIAFTLVALATSMFWFPAPEDVDPKIAEFLAFEKAWLTGAWTSEKVVSTLAVPAVLAMLCLAFWKRSLVWGLISKRHRRLEGRLGRRGWRQRGLGDARSGPRGTPDLRRGSAVRGAPGTRAGARPKTGAATREPVGWSARMTPLLIQRELEVRKEDTS